MEKYWFACIAGGIACAPAPVFAQGAASSEAEGTKTPAIVVTATRSERSVADVPASVTVLTRDDLREMAAQSLDEALRDVVGFEPLLMPSYRAHPTSNMVSMRGLKSGVTSHVLVMVDGVPINDSFSGYVQWNRVPVENIERVEIVRGGGASLWGTYALGGVINVITQAPTKADFYADAGYGTYGTWRASAGGSIVASDAARFWVFASRNSTDGFNGVIPQFVNGSTIWGKTSFDATNVQLGGHFKADPSLYGHARLNYHENDQVLFTPVDTNNHRIYNLDAQVTKRFGDQYSVVATLFHNDGNFLTNNSGYDAYGPPNGASLTPGFPATEVLSNSHRTKVRDTGASLVWSGNFGPAVPLVSVGVDARYIDGRDTGDIFDDIYGTLSGTPGGFLRTDVGSGKQRFLGAFGQVSYFPVSALEILASVRAQNWRNYDGFDGTGPTPIGALPDRSESSVDPRVSARYELSRHFALRGAVYKAFNAPNLDNLYRAFGTGTGIFLANPDLKPERVTGADLGFDWRTPRGELKASLFANRMRDMITSRQLSFAEAAFYGAFFGTQWANAGRVKSRGLELEWTHLLTKTLLLRAGYTYTDSEIQESSDPASVGQPLANLPKNKANLGITYDDSKYQATLAARYQSSTFGVQGDPSFFNSNGWGVHLDSFVTFDATASAKLSPGFSVYAQVVNLFDRTYIADNSGFSAPLRGTPRTFFAGVKYKLP